MRSKPVYQTPSGNPVMQAEAGKTRLSIQAADEVTHEYACGG